MLLSGFDRRAGDSVGVRALEEKPAREGGRTRLVVLWKLEVPWVGSGELRLIKLVPFLPSAEAGASAAREVVANVLLFVPFGLYLDLLAPSWSWRKVTGVVVGSSLVLEVAQYGFAVGSSDVTDVIVNAAGGLAGLGLLALARRRFQARTAAVMTRACTIGTVLALVAVVLFIASPLRYGPREAAVAAPSVAPGLDAERPRVKELAPEQPES